VSKETHCHGNFLSLCFTPTFGVATKDIACSKEKGTNTGAALELVHAHMCNTYRVLKNPIKDVGKLAE